MIHSPNSEKDTLKCPKCGEIWFAEGYYNYDEGGWGHGEDGWCPLGCKGFLGLFPVQGQVIPRN